MKVIKNYYEKLNNLPFDTKVVVKYKRNAKTIEAVRGTLKKVMLKTMVVCDDENGFYKVFYYNDVVAVEYRRK